MWRDGWKCIEVGNINSRYDVCACVPQSSLAPAQQRIRKQLYSYTLPETLHFHSFNYIVSPYLFRQPSRCALLSCDLFHMSARHSTVPNFDCFYVSGSRSLTYYQHQHTAKVEILPAVREAMFLLFKKEADRRQTGPFGTFKVNLVTAGTRPRRLFLM